jgi:hypothetical protein
MGVSEDSYPLLSGSNRRAGGHTYTKALYIVMLNLLMVTQRLGTVWHDYIVVEDG